MTNCAELYHLLPTVYMLANCVHSLQTATNCVHLLSTATNNCAPTAPTVVYTCSKLLATVYTCHFTATHVCSKGTQLRKSPSDRLRESLLVEGERNRGLVYVCGEGRYLWPVLGVLAPLGTRGLVGDLLPVGT